MQGHRSAVPQLLLLEVVSLPTICGCAFKRRPSGSWRRTRHLVRAEPALRLPDCMHEGRTSVNGLRTASGDAAPLACPIRCGIIEVIRAATTRGTTVHRSGQWTRRTIGEFCSIPTIICWLVVASLNTLPPWSAMGSPAEGWQTATCPRCGNPADLEAMRFGQVGRFRCIASPEHVFLVGVCPNDGEQAASRGPQWVCATGHPPFDARLCPRCGRFSSFQPRSDGWLLCEGGCGEFTVGPCQCPQCRGGGYAVWLASTDGPWVCELYG